MSTYHYDGSPCPESCTCAVREVDRLRTQLEAVTRERDSWRSQRDEVHAEMERQTQLKREERQAKLDAQRERDEAIREYLADHGGDPYKAPPRAPGAEPTPRDMRVAEAVREACVETADASDEASRRVAGDLRDLDLAAVVAKAVKP